MLILFLCPFAFGEFVDMKDPRFKLPENQLPVFTDSKDPRNILQKYDQNFSPKLQDYLDPRVRQFDFLTSDFNQTTDFNVLDLNLSLIGSPAGDTNQIQFNNGGAFAADTNFQWRTYENGGLLGSGQLLFYGPNKTNGRKIPDLTGTNSYFYYHPYLGTFRVGSFSAETFSDANLNNGGVIIGGNSAVGGTNNINIGYSTSINGTSAINLGSNNVIRNAPDSGLAIGNFNDVNGTFAIAIGISSRAYNGRNVAIGYASQATGAQSSVAIGTSTASAINAVALGNATASAQNATAVGQGNASGVGAFAGGSLASASGQYSLSYGPSSNTVASGSSAFAFGNFTRAFSDYSMAFGLRNDANSTAMAVFGLYAPQYAGFSQTGIESHSPLFIVGNGTAPTARKAAFAIRKDGNTSIGWIDGNAPNRLDVNAVNGYMRLAGDLNVVSHQKDAIPNLYIKASDGNIGINTVAPKNKLNIFGDLNTGNNLGSAVFDINGTLKLYGTATVFTDLYTPIISAKLAGVNDPDFTDFNGIGTYAYEFQNNVVATEDEVFLTFQMPHSYKLNSQFKPHIHWSPDSSNTGNSRFQLNCSKADINSQFTQITFRFDANSTTNKFGTHQISDSNITTSCTNISCIMQCRLWRNSSATEDDYASGTYLHAIDFHIEMDTLGSDAEYVK